MEKDLKIRLLYISIFFILGITDNNCIFEIDEERMQEELQDLIDDNPIEESDGSDSDSPSKKRRRSVEDLDDRLEDDDYELIEENLGVKVQRKVSSAN